MAKYSGKIGFRKTVETEPGIHEEITTERIYFGDITKNYRPVVSSEKVNDDVNISNVISIVADPYANNNIFAMRYAEFMGAKWTIKNVEVQYPRLLLSLGGLYNDE